MKVFVTAKVRPFLIISSVLAVWMLLAAQPSVAHDETLRSVRCSNIPDATFFTATETAAITSAEENPDNVDTKRGQGTSTRMGDPNYHYAKITVPALTAGELRVFDASADPVSDAVLCRRGSEIASSRTNYSSHNTLESAQATALRAQTAAQAAADNASISESAAKRALRSAASALTSAANTLRSYGDPTNADTVDGFATAATTQANEATDNDVSDETGALGTAAGNLGTAAGNLGTLADGLHSGFKIRATVEPGDEEYVLIVTLPDGVDGNTPSTGIDLNVAFNGAIVTADSDHTNIENSLNQGDQHQYTLDITAPGLLTVETKGNTDTAGMLSGTETADDDSSGSGNNFKMVLPVTGGSNYILTVDGQTPTTEGEYTLDMAFKVAMTHTPDADVTGADVVAGPTWADSTGTSDDGSDTGDTPAILKEPNNSVDEDYFLISIAANSSGFLTVETTDDGTPADDANTTGVLYGPMGEIDTDSDSGTGNHFKMRAPVEEGMDYLVKVSGSSGSEGAYRLKLTLDRAEGDDLLTVPGAQNAPAPSDCSGSVPGEICAPDPGESLEIERYVFNVMESGALDVRTTGDIDTVGTLYGPDGNRINNPDADDNRGDGNNFRISASVGPGLHLVEVRGKERTTQGVYNLIVNFVPGAEPVDPTTPTPPTTPGGPAANSTGELEEPASGSARSGIGLVRGWVCQDGGDGVEIRIMNSDGDRVATFTAPYGSERDDVDVADACDGQRSTDVGFATQFNYNLLPAGTYTVEAFVDGDQIGRANDQTNTFTVVRIGGEFLERPLRGDRRIRVEDFPRQGTTTILQWDRESQNFQIVDTE